MPFPPGYHPTPRGAPLDKAVADARWVVTNAEDTLHAVHTRIVDGLVGGLPYPLLEEAADAAVEARGDLVEGSEIIDQVALDTSIPRVVTWAWSATGTEPTWSEDGNERGPPTWRAAPSSTGWTARRRSNDTGHSWTSADAHRR